VLRISISETRHALPILESIRRTRLRIQSGVKRGSLLFFSSRERRSLISRGSSILSIVGAAGYASLISTMLESLSEDAVCTAAYAVCDDIEHTQTVIS